MAKDSISPITKRLLPLPGQSVDATLQSFIEDHFLAPLFVLVFLFAICGFEWVGYLNRAPRNPWIYSVIAILAAVVVAIYWRLNWSRLKALKLGRDGERAVAECLSVCLDGQSRLFHDVPCAYGNIDHVVISHRGIYAIETKTRSKPRRRRAVVVVENEHLKVDGFKPDRDPMNQARSCAADLSRLLQELTSKRFTVRPVVVFPGWSIEDRREQQSLVWVLDPKELPSRIELEPQIFVDSDISSVAGHLSRYIRGSN